MLIERPKIIKVQTPKEFLRFKIGIFGDCMVGKTTLAQKYTKQTLNDSYQATIGVDYLNIVIEKDYNYNINLWDFSGEFNTYLELRNEFYKEMTAIIYLFDTGLKRTLDNIEQYIKETNDNGGKEIVQFLVGNSKDGNRVIQESQGKDFAAKNKINYAEIDAKSGNGVQDLFTRIIKAVLAG